MATGHTVAPGIKAVRLDDLPEEAWQHLVGESGSDQMQKLYAAVAWLYAAVDIRANAVATMPWELARGKTVILTHEDGDLPPDFSWMRLLPHLLYRTEAATALDGRAYWLKQKQDKPDTPGLRWLLPSSITPQFSEAEGVTGFKRRLGQKNIPLTLQEVVYFWPPDPYVEIGPQTNTPGKAALSAAGVLNNLEGFVTGYFERGLVKATLLTYQEAISPDERDRVKEWWRRVATGIKNAFSTEVVRGDFTPVVIGEGLADLANTELTELEREAICTALRVPQSKLAANAANFATKQSDDLMFITDLVAPRCNWIQSVLNEQLFAPLGVSFRFLPDTLSIMQEDEEQRAESLLALVNAGMRLEVALEILGYDIPEGMDVREDEPEPPPVMVPAMQPAQEPAVEPPEVTAEKATFRRWLKNRANPNAADFESDILSNQQKALVMLEMGIYPQGDADSDDAPFRWEGYP